MKRKKGKRFVQVSNDASLNGNVTVFVDQVTGVNYVLCEYIGASGFSVLVDTEGKPVVTKIED